MLLARLTRAHHSMVSRSRRHPCSKLVSSAFATSQPEWSPVHVTSSCELLLAFRLLEAAPGLGAGGPSRTHGCSMVALMI